MCLLTVLFQVASVLDKLTGGVLFLASDEEQSNSEFLAGFSSKSS